MFQDKEIKEGVEICENGYYSKANPKTNYSLENTQLYPLKLLEKQYRNIFITIPHTTLDYNNLLDQLLNELKTTYTIICQEKHEDGDTHLHILLIFSDKYRLKKIHNLINKELQNIGETIKGTIDYQTPKDILKVITYIKKDNNYKEIGTIPVKTGRVGKQKLTNLEETNLPYTQLLDIIETTNDKEAVIEYYKKNCPRDYFLHYDKIENRIDTLLKPKHKKFSYVKQTINNTNFNLWQEELNKLLLEPPKPRRIIWIHGEAGVGKSFMFNYLTDNYEYGFYQAGQTASLDKLAYTYKEEGIIAWDLPMNFNFTDDNLRMALCNVIEKFSDFGQIISSQKYAGTNIRVLGHAVVFSNSPPLKELSHRDVVVIHAKKPIPYKVINNKIVAQYSIDNTTKYYYYQTIDELEKNFYNDIEIEEEPN